MMQALVWDLPTRLFHWLLAAGFASAAFIALVVGDDGPLFPYHAIIGLTLALMVALRLVWGVIGSKHARFGSFLFGPAAVAEYLKGIVTGRGKRHIGHNPASAYAIFAMLALIAAMAVTGVMLGRGQESVKDLHEFCAYAMLAVVGVHVLGVLLHTARHRENITAGMLHGRKAVEAGQGIASARPVAAAIFLVLIGAWGFTLIRNYDPATQATSLPLLGMSLQLGEAEREGGAEGGDGSEASDRGHHEDEDD
ncbi:MAG: cytochrome b/b6 domain-containing protein [Phycisphaeraceae bacterium]|nr:cytochrome b/b6 domain-containing protein [Phycisphaeraceae bacterium]MBX3366688.1 cytochrome b/b6 domain-containing protein [Phycisphaeraceae bacterium]